MKEPPAVEKSPAVKEPLVLKEPPAFKESPAASKHVRQGSPGQRDLPKEMLVLKEPPAVKELYQQDWQICLHRSPRSWQL